MLVGVESLGKSKLCNAVIHIAVDQTTRHTSELKPGMWHLSFSTVDCKATTNAVSLIQSQAEYNNVKVIVCIVLKAGLLTLKKFYIHICLGVSVATCMAILQVGSGLQLRSASTGTKEEDYENDAATIVQKCVSFMSTSVKTKVGTPLVYQLTLVKGLYRYTKVIFGF